ncbi:ArpU family transcriptional regulator [Enterococcus sp.]|uniref:ArpU family transcriptional regulator n=1 Tax=Enterococcus sp. TaxID=35783 RepID=UPI003FA5CA1F
MKFDLEKYRQPEVEEIDWPATRANFKVFLVAYRRAREKVGQPPAPKVTQSFMLVPPSTTNPRSGEAERMLIRREEDLEEFNELHELFMDGYAAINTVNPERSERRKKIFFLRYLQGLLVEEISERLFIGRDLISQESKKAIQQFCNELELTVMKSETKKSK